MVSRVLRTSLPCAFGLFPLIVLGVLALFSYPGAAQQQSYLSSVEVDAKRAGKNFSVDGDLSKAQWKRAAWAHFDHDASGKSRYPGLETRIASLWTDDSVYFAFSARYASLNIYAGEDPAKERWQLWERDVVEVFLNPQPERVNHYYEFEVAPNNQ